MKEKITTILFDLDGTLLNTLEDLADSVNEIMRRYLWPEHSLQAIRSFVGNGMRKLIERSIPDGKENPLYEQVFQEFQSYYLSHCQIKTRPYEGVLELMGELKAAGYDIAIVSNKRQNAVEELNELYFKKYTNTVVGDREGARCKPAPDAVFFALENMGRTVKEAIYIGDSEVDYETAKNSGLPCVLVSWGFRDREMLLYMEGATVVDSCQEIKNILL